MAAGLYVLENLANLELLPAVGACIIALPMKLQGGSGARRVFWHSSRILAPQSVECDCAPS